MYDRLWGVCVGGGGGELLPTIIVGVYHDGSGPAMEETEREKKNLRCRTLNVFKVF